jgi:hypothetical protein
MELADHWQGSIARAHGWPAGRGAESKRAWLLSGDSDRRERAEWLGAGMADRRLSAAFSVRKDHRAPGRLGDGPARDRPGRDGPG